MEVARCSGKRKRELREGCSGSSKRKRNKNPTRWSVARSESSKRLLFEVVRGMGATRHKPVLRHELREKARKHIGDTGLLDHLLKHMAGKVIVEGTEKLVRRHNSEGAIEYWLEPAELAQIRTEAGIADPYWTPPSGWKPGDSISNYTGDGQVTSQLRDEIILLKR